MIYDLGQACIVHKGAYSSSTAYRPLNTVTNLGGLFLCIQACTGVEPGTTSGWESYWSAAANGIKQYNLSVSGSTATVTVTYTNGQSATFTYSTAAVADNSVGTLQLINGEVTYAKLNSDAKSYDTSASVATGAWANYTATVSVSGLLSTDNIIVSPAPASFVEWRDCGVYCSGQGNGSITLTCEIVPSTALTAQILVVR